MPSAANDPSEAYDKMKEGAEQIRNRCTRMSDQLGIAADVPGADVLRFYEALGAYRE